MTEREIIKILKARIEKAGTAKAFAKLHGFSGAFISNVVQRKSAVSPKLAKALGFEIIKSENKFVPLKK